ncbi:MAG: hypothetical protein IMY76_05140 [Chloroflexi bacterium]|nr:hypothetical protein [Chloroflexota bacterium]
MKKRLLLFTILFSFLLTACNAEAETTEVVVPDTPTSVPVPTATLETVETGEFTVPVPMTTLDNGCTLTSSVPEAPQEYVELFGVTENDWVKGPETAALTIVEYGDFQ